MDTSISAQKSENEMKASASKSQKERTKNVKRHKCLICLKSFIQTSQLEYHTFMAHTNERPYKCTVCGWTSKTLAYLKQHERLHVGEKRYTCTKCSSKFSSWSDRNNHFNQVHDNLWPCEICKRVFKGKEKLARHELIHSDLKQFVCIFCEHRSRTLPNLMSHISNLHTREKPFPCSECPAEYSQSSSLKAHIRSAHRKEEWANKCSICDKKFPTKGNLNRHQQTHTGERPYICSYSGCNKKFPTQGELSRHNKSHVGEKKYTCSICGNGFVTTAMLNQHVKIHDKKFSCNICTKMFPSAFFLKEHQKTHSETRQFKCEECPSSFFIKGQLNNHVRQIHRKLRPFPCSMCDKSFYRPGLRDKHLAASHLNEKHYKCEICDKRHKKGISEHVKRHNELTDLRCGVCPKSFINRTDLLEHHLKKHVGKNYDLLFCVFCNYKFHKIRPLENHMNRHTNERPYFCGICSADFFTERRLKAHERKLHRNRR